MDMDTKDGSVFGDCVTRIAKALKLKPGSETLITTQLQELHPFAKHLLDSNEVGSSRGAWAKATCLKLENMKKLSAKLFTSWDAQGSRSNCQFEFSLGSAEYWCGEADWLGQVCVL